MFKKIKDQHAHIIDMIDYFETYNNGRVDFGTSEYSTIVGTDKHQFT